MIGNECSSTQQEVLYAHYPGSLLTEWFPVAYSMDRLGEDWIRHRSLCHGNQEALWCLGQTFGRRKQTVHLRRALATIFSCLEFEVVRSNLHGQVANCRWKDVGQQTDVVFFASVLCSDRTSLRTSLLSEVVTRSHHFTGTKFVPVSIPASFQALRNSAQIYSFPGFFLPHISQQLQSPRTNTQLPTWPSTLGSGDLSKASSMVRPKSSCRWHSDLEFSHPSSGRKCDELPTRDLGILFFDFFKRNMLYIYKECLHPEVLNPHPTSQSFAFFWKILEFNGWPVWPWPEWFRSRFGQCLLPKRERSWEVRTVSFHLPGVQEVFQLKATHLKSLSFPHEGSCKNREFFPTCDWMSGLEV